MKMRYALVLVVGLCCLTGCSGDDDPVARVTCERAQDTDFGNIGWLNTNQFPLGQVVLANRANERAASLMTLAYDDSDVNVQDFGNREEAFNAEFEVDFSAGFPAGIEADVTSGIKNETQLRAVNLRQREFGDFLSLLEGDEKQRILDQIEGDTSLVAYVIHRMASADSLYLLQANASSVEGNTSTVAYGDYDVRISYDCSDEFEMSGEDVGVFWKANALRYDPDGDRFLLDAQARPLKEYDLTYAR